MQCELCEKYQLGYPVMIASGVYHIDLCSRHRNEADRAFKATPLWLRYLEMVADYNALDARSGTDGYALADEFLATDKRRHAILAECFAWAEAWANERRPKTADQQEPNR